MLSVAFTKYYYNIQNTTVDVYGLSSPQGYDCHNFYEINLIKDRLDYENLVLSDVIIYASGAGVQAALNTDSTLMYSLNVSVPIDITIMLKQLGYKGVFVSFGSYMEIGVNDEDGKSFKEEEVVLSELPVTNDYGLSKRLFGRYMNDFTADFTFYHFILPNMFSEDDLSSEITEDTIDSIFDEEMLVKTEDEADDYLAKEGSNVALSYVAVPTDAKVGSYCYKMLIDSHSHMLYYFKKHRITKKAGAGFLAEDINRIASYRVN